MPVIFEKVDQDVLDLVREVIDQWHTVLQAARIGVCFRSEAQKRGEHTVWAAISKVTPHVGVLARLDFVLWLAKPEWERMPRVARLALLDHELCHAIENDKGDWAIREHDVEEFYEVIQRHGLWRRDLVQLGQVVRDAQLSLPGFEDVQVTIEAAGQVVTLAVGPAPTTRELAARVVAAFPEVGPRALAAICQCSSSTAHLVLQELRSSGDAANGSGSQVEQSLERN